MSDLAGSKIKDVIGDRNFLRSLNPKDFTDDQFGLPTVTDIISELEKPGRDPRGEFKTASFEEGVETLADLKNDMVLEGVVTNVTNFGAFVDIGVHQDGLVHISAMSDKFIKDPREVVKAGDLVKVKVMEVDIERKRVGLSMRLSDSSETISSGMSKRTASKERLSRNQKQHQAEKSKPASGGAMADALASAFNKRR